MQETNRPESYHSFLPCVNATRESEKRLLHLHGLNPQPWALRNGRALGLTGAGAAPLSPAWPPPPPSGQPRAPSSRPRGTRPAPAVPPSAPGAPRTCRPSRATASATRGSIPGCGRGRGREGMGGGGRGGAGPCRSAAWCGGGSAEGWDERKVPRTEPGSTRCCHPPPSAPHPAVSPSSTPSSDPPPCAPHFCRAALSPHLHHPPCPTQPEAVPPGLSRRSKAGGGWWCRKAALLGQAGSEAAALHPRQGINRRPNPGPRAPQDPQGPPIHSRAHGASVTPHTGPRSQRRGEALAGVSSVQSSLEQEELYKKSKEGY